MKRKLAAVLITVFVAVSVGSFTACATPSVTAIAAAPGTEVISLLAGETAILELSFSFDTENISAGQQAEVVAGLSATYASDNEDICTVDNSGAVTALSGGTATVTAVIGEELTATWSVNVAVPVEKITAIETLTLELNGENSGNVTAQISPENATDSGISYTTSNPEIATVDTQGKVTAVAFGECDITATAGGKSAKTTITVITVPESIELESTEGILYVGNSFTLNPVILPEEAAQDFTVKSDNNEVATATKNEDGSVTLSAVGVGTANILIQAGNINATYVLTVQARPVQTAPTPNGGTAPSGGGQGSPPPADNPSGGEGTPPPSGGGGWDNPTAPPPDQPLTPLEPGDPGSDI